MLSRFLLFRREKTSNWKKLILCLKKEDNKVDQFCVRFVFKTKALFDNPIQHLDLTDSDLNIFKPFDNKKLNI